MLDGAGRALQKRSNARDFEPIFRLFEERTSLVKAEISDKTLPARIPHRGDLPALRRAAAKCTACPLYRQATQVVFGEGAADAGIMLVGEQPGDQEDLQGRPFVGPAGRILDRAMAEAGIERESAYVTNAVKHFKWEARGKRRLHRKPGAREVAACRPWLIEELSIVRPRVLVCLGATATQALLGRSVRVLRDRGKAIPSEFCAGTLVTVHPSSLLRAPDAETRERNYAAFVADLRAAAALMRQGGGMRPRRTAFPNFGHAGSAASHL